MRASGPPWKCQHAPVRMLVAQKMNRGAFEPGAGRSDSFCLKRGSYSSARKLADTEKGFSAYPLEKVYSRPCSGPADGAECLSLRRLACSVDGTPELCPAERTLPEPARVPASCA